MRKYEILKVIVGKEFITVKYGEFCKQENGGFCKIYRITRKMKKASKNVFEFMRKTKSSTDKNGNYIYKAELTTENNKMKEVRKMKNNYREFKHDGKQYYVANSNGDYRGKYVLMQYSTYYSAWIKVGNYANTIKEVKNSIID